MLDDESIMGENKIKPRRKPGSISMCVCFGEGKSMLLFKTVCLVFPLKITSEQRPQEGGKPS